MTRWFGERWNPHCCDPAEKVETPVGQPCRSCREPIFLGQQGFVLDLIGFDGHHGTDYQHLDCFLKRILPHDVTCPHCRGREREDHATHCEHRVSGGDCNCVRLEDL